jgi:hypothetical protein
MLDLVESATGSAVARESAALEWVHLLSEEIGGRRPTGPAERRAAELVADRLRRSGLSVEMRPFGAHSTFAIQYGAGLAIALLGAPISRRHPLRASVAAAAGGALASAEDGLVHRPLTRLFARRESHNLVATIEPTGETHRTVCLVCHLDTSRSGLIFHRRFLPILHGWIAAQAAALAAVIAAPLIRLLPSGSRVVRAAYGVLAAGLGLLIERELRGVDVPGANDNASGVAAVATLASELQAGPLPNTRVICLFTGCEEAGLLGADAFLRELEVAGEDWCAWHFLNFDGVAAPATLRFLRHEGVLRKWRSDSRLLGIAERLAARRPELGLRGAEHNAGLIYDTTPVLIRGGRAITFSAQDWTIPNYHSPTDTVENIDPNVLQHAIEVGREMLAAIDRGEAG